MKWKSKCEFCGQAYGQRRVPDPRICMNCLRAENEEQELAGELQTDADVKAELKQQLAAAREERALLERLE